MEELRQGFHGNADLYGVGIRIGYYTAALSIWIGNLWAPCEIYYLRHVTLVFLVAMVVGVSVMSMNPEVVYAVEPFMLMHVSYCTYYMGMLIPASPEVLVWEKEYFAFYVGAIIGLLLHGYDTWYWFYGQSLMRRTPGVEKTMGLFVYFGQQDLFGWIEYPMKVYLIFFITRAIRRMVAHMYYRQLEKKLNTEVPPARLKMLCGTWQRELDTSFTAHHPIQDNLLLSAPERSRNPSLNSLHNPCLNQPRLSTISQDDTLNTARRTSTWLSDYEKKSTLGDESSTPEMGIQRSLSEKIRYRILGWQIDTYNLGTTRVYTYHPTLETLITTCKFLESLNEKEFNRWSWTIWLWYPYAYIFQCLRLVFAIGRHGFRPRFLFALTSHIHAMDHAQRVLKPVALRRAVNHPLYHNITAEDITLASRILFVTKPRPPLSGWMKLGWAYALFMTCSMLVIGTELTINWNYIADVQTLKTVGQLVPAAIGTGGLMRVIYSAVFEPNAMEELCLGRCKLRPRKVAWKDAGDAWSRAKDAWERRRDYHSNGKGKGKKKEKVVKA